MMALPVITHEELLCHAADGNTYARAEACRDNVFDVNCTPSGDDEFVVSCKCEVQLCNCVYFCIYINCVITCVS